MQDSSIEGKVALVTGGARGLGRSYALQLAERGADVAIADVDLSAYEEYEREREWMEADSVEAEIERHGVEALGIEVDVTDSAAVEAMAETVADEFGTIDVAVANAGGGVGEAGGTRASDIPLDALHATVERNLYGTIYTCMAVAPYMKDQGSGRIITVSSQAGREATPTGGYAHYGAAKAGVIMYTKYLAQELGEYGVTANVIAPGYIGTGRLMETFEREGVETFEEQVALGRLGTPEDCATVVEFLASEASKYVTGTVIPIDGGSTRF